MKFFKHDFIRNVMKVGGGAAGGQFILVLASPIITRLYGPEPFGLWGVFSSIAGIVVPAAALSYTTAIILPRDEATARGLVRISLIATVTTSIATTLLFLAAGPALATALGVRTASSILPLIGAFVLAAGLGEVARQRMIRQQQFNGLAVTNSSASMITAAAQVVGGLIAPGALTLVLTSTFSKLADSAAKWWLVTRNSTTSGEIGLRGLRLRPLASEYRHFPLFRMPQVVIDGVSQAIPPVMLAAFFGPAAAGFYTLCRTVLLLPGGLIGNAVADVFYPRITAAFQGQELLTRIVVKASALTFFAGTLPFITIILFGPWLFTLAFGTEWSEAGTYAQWMSIWLWPMLANRPALQAIHVLSLQKFHLMFTIAGTILRLGAIVGAYAVFATPIASVAAYSIVGCVSNLVLIAAVVYVCRRQDRRNEVHRS